MERVISKETHTKFRMTLEQTLQDYYVFLVPNHLVNEDGMIDKKITDNITKIVDTSWDHISDCSKSISFSDCEGLGNLDDPSLEVLEIQNDNLNFDPDYDQDLPVFGNSFNISKTNEIV